MTQESAFDLTAERAHKAAPERIAADETRFRAIADALDADIAALEAHLDDALTRRTGDAQGRVEREAHVDHARRRLRSLRGIRRDVVLGRMLPADGGEAVYVGRQGVRDAAGRVLLVDWRSPAAEPFFSATRSRPHGLVSRRRYRWAGGRVRDYWDESLTDGPERAGESLDEESALLTALARARSPRMQDVLTTLAADQDAIIRAGAARPLVVDGGPGTGKTVVALHRAAYLLHHDPRLREGRGEVLVVGPHRPYLHYVADVLPHLGEDGVRTCTLADLVPEGAAAGAEADPAVAALKGRQVMVEAIEPAVALYEEPPTAPHEARTPWGSAIVDAGLWAEVFGAVDPGTPHNLAREELREELAEVVAAQLEEHPGIDAVREELRRDEELERILRRAWPLLTATDLLGDLYEVPAYLRRCAPSLGEEQVRLLQRVRPREWTVSDLPLLDALRHRLGDPGAEERRRRVRAAQRETVEEIDLLVEDLIASDSSAMQEMSMLRGDDLRHALEDRATVPVPPPDALAGPFAHVVVDEAQELDDAQWAMILRRCPSRRLTLVGDRAQAAHGFAESWERRLARVGLERIDRATLTLNYRTPREIMEEAAPVIRAALPDANVPTSLRTTGTPVRRGRVEELQEVLAAWLAAHEEGTAAVIGDGTHPSGPRVRSLTPALAKGLEFDLVVLMAPEALGEGLEGAVARYVAMTRATAELVMLA
ncbi:RNA polymerase recycling motor ATPase HelR [Brachybacterium sp. YJGR34]|uniref:RNA polymerase recycling motor ATPase HelR n=1 Tax=Brachybacterium sp. YJGR34 TaxID=2059911 RepID=UPI000E0AD197|nr:RNA polymerase recycling motor ATPase HelR [Brachybacterium sp. YJGR34]